MKRCAVIATVVACSTGAVARADYNLSLEFLSAYGGEFQQVIVGERDTLQGSLTTVVANFVMTASTGFTYANDLTILIAEDLDSDPIIQIGGFTDWGAGFRYAWPNGASSTPGTTGGGDLSIPSIPVTGLKLFVGNGYDGGLTATGTWLGNVVLFGVDLVVNPGPAIPAPGAIAVLGLAGVFTRRRRR